MARKVSVNYARKRRDVQVPIRAVISRRQGESAKYAFQACVHIGRRGHSAAHPGQGRVAVDGFECATGPAPRRALAAAMKKLGTVLTKRSSSFRGWRRKQYKKRRR